MATVGFKAIHLAELGKDDKVVKEFEVSAAKGGSIGAKIAGIGATANTVYASNVPFYVSAQGVSSPKLTLDIADLYPELAAAMTGAKTTKEGFVTIGADTKPPYMSVVLETNDKDGNSLFIGLMKGKFTAPDEELKTAEDKGVELQTDSVEGDFIARSADALVYAKASTATASVTLEAFKEFVFGGKAAGKL